FFSYLFSQIFQKYRTDLVLERLHKDAAFIIQQMERKPFHEHEQQQFYFDWSRQLGMHMIVYDENDGRVFDSTNLIQIPINLSLEAFINQLSEENTNDWFWKKNDFYYLQALGDGRWLLFILPVQPPTNLFVFIGIIIGISILIIFLIGNHF